MANQGNTGGNGTGGAGGAQGARQTPVDSFGNARATGEAPVLKVGGSQPGGVAQPNAVKKPTAS